MLFFSSGREGPQNIYMSVFQPDGGWGPANPVEELNTLFNDARPNVRKDGLEIVFDSDRPAGLGGFDIYSAARSSIFEPWSQPEPLGPNVNSASSETRASLSRDGSRLHFGSNRPGGQGNSEIYMSRRSGPGRRPGTASLPISRSPSPEAER
jgi:Tol biopolymer transport system component